MLEYLLYFASIVIFGDAALIALLYFAIAGNIGLGGVLVTGILATVATDTMWYTIGYWFPAGKIFGKLKIPTIKEKYSTFAIFFEKHSLKALFYSKFILGIRTPVRALYGAKKLDLWPFIGINTFAGTLWISIITILAKTLKSNLPDLENTMQEIIVALSVLALGTVVIYLIAQKIVNRKINLDSKNPK